MYARKEHRLKTTYGSLWMRFWRGGVALAPIEAAILRIVHDALPGHMATIFDQQLEGVNLVQRVLIPSHQTGRAAWRGLHFYRIKNGRVDRSDLPKLPVKGGEVKLLRLKLSVGSTGSVLNIAAYAMNGWFFDIQSGEDWRPLTKERALTVQDVHQSWRSNVVPPG